MYSIIHLAGGRNIFQYVILNNDIGIIAKISMAKEIPRMDVLEE